MKDYGEIMAEAAGDGYESPSAAAIARFWAKLDARADAEDDLDAEDEE